MFSGLILTRFPTLYLILSIFYKVFFKEICMSCCAVVVAAGYGRRMGADRPKQFLCLDNRPILVHTLMRLSEIEFIEGIVLVVSQQEIDDCKKDIVDAYAIKKIVSVVKGGARRQDSVFNGLNALSDINPDYVLVHDGVRPFFSKDLCKRVFDGLKEFSAVIPGLSIAPTIKEVDSDSIVSSTLNRDDLREIQTPQGANYKMLLSVYKTLIKDSIVVTDEASAMEFLGKKVKVVEGNRENFKITTPFDLGLAEYIISQEVIV